MANYDVTPISFIVTVQDEFSINLKSFQTLIFRVSSCNLVINNLVAGIFAQYFPNAGVMLAAFVCSEEFHWESKFTVITTAWYSIVRNRHTSAKSSSS